MIHTLVLDLDGTLLDNDKKINPLTKDALITVQQNGVRLILASGRPLTGIIPYSKELEMEQYDGIIISHNGAVVTGCKSWSTIMSHEIPMDLSSTLLNHLDSFDVITMLCDDTYLYVKDAYNCTIKINNTDFNIIQYEARGGNFLIQEVRSFSELSSLPLNKILIAGNADYLLQHHIQISEPVSNKLSHVFTAPFYYEFTALNVDKASSLDTLMKSLNLSSEGILAFGDGHNDISLIKYAGIGIAMDNAVASLKEASNDITLSNTNNGIVVSLHKYLTHIFNK